MAQERTLPPIPAHIEGGQSVDPQDYLDQCHRDEQAALCSEELNAECQILIDHVSEEPIPEAPGGYQNSSLERLRKYFLDLEDAGVIDYIMNGREIPVDEGAPVGSGKVGVEEEEVAEEEVTVGASFQARGRPSRGLVPLPAVGALAAFSAAAILNASRLEDGESGGREISQKTDPRLDRLNEGSQGIPIGDAATAAHLGILIFNNGVKETDNVRSRPDKEDKGDLAVEILVAGALPFVVNPFESAASNEGEKGGFQKGAVRELEPIRLSSSSDPDQLAAALGEVPFSPFQRGSLQNGKDPGFPVSFHLGGAVAPHGAEFLFVGYPVVLPRMATASLPLNTSGGESRMAYRVEPNEGGASSQEHGRGDSGSQKKGHQGGQGKGEQQQQSTQGLS